MQGDPWRINYRGARPAGPQSPNKDADHSLHRAGQDPVTTAAGVESRPGGAAAAEGTRPDPPALERAAAEGLAPLGLSPSASLGKARRPGKRHPLSQGAASGAWRERPGGLGAKSRELAAETHSRSVSRRGGLGSCEMICRFRRTGTRRRRTLASRREGRRGQAPEKVGRTAGAQVWGQLPTEAASPGRTGRTGRDGSGFQQGSRSGSRRGMGTVHPSARN